MAQSSAQTFTSDSGCHSDGRMNISLSEIEPSIPKEAICDLDFFPSDHMPGLKSSSGVMSISGSQSSQTEQQRVPDAVPGPSSRAQRSTFAPFNCKNLESLDVSRLAHDFCENMQKRAGMGPIQPAAKASINENEERSQQSTSESETENPPLKRKREHRAENSNKKSKKATGSDNVAGVGPTTSQSKKVTSNRRVQQNEPTTSNRSALSTPLMLSPLTNAPAVTFGCEICTKSFNDARKFDDHMQAHIAKN